jgi:hypothetical protein
VKKTPLSSAEIRRLQTRCKELAARLGNFDSLSQGSVMFAPPGAWRWTRKVAGKTVSVGLSPQKAQMMQQAIANQRVLDMVIDEIREATQKLILGTPETPPTPKAVRRPK